MIELVKTVEILSVEIADKDKWHKIYKEVPLDDSSIGELQEGKEWEIKEGTKEFKTLDEALDEASEEEKAIYDEANLEKGEVNGREVLQRTDIDYDAVDSLGRTNLERMQKGLPPLVEGKPIELHHIGQKSDSPLAELTVEEHRGQGNDGILHDKTVESDIDRQEFKKEREDHWKERAAQVLEERGNG
ncbi:HNH/ENDO VII family nuclease [Anaerobacillus sp. CMMVII]|uniref:HNH/ENDO VII family nuclease n=1 Tax=Anaerobacillus sp. CMMVII TaxID=2755588 RepID=UPI0021B73A35|nr:HNH/ENDO VII family nuclease [Anaerobacillus sp. CMMVII]MCT8137600.1 HNH/ENDO VII family nuclease [Anaerobacillus sp. CMMVII]